MQKIQARLDDVEIIEIKIEIFLSEIKFDVKIVKSDVSSLNSNHVKLSNDVNYGMKQIL